MFSTERKAFCELNLKSDSLDQNEIKDIYVICFVQNIGGLKIIFELLVFV